MTDADHVVLLDDEGRAIGTAPKSSVHGTDTALHLAFSCHVVNAAATRPPNITFLVLLDQCAYVRDLLVDGWEPFSRPNRIVVHPLHSVSDDLLHNVFGIIA